MEPFTAVRSFLGEEEDDDESMPHDATSKVRVHLQLKVGPTSLC